MEQRSPEGPTEILEMPKSRAVNGSEHVVIAAIASGAPVAISAMITVRGV
jgi:hypothetical protein